MTIRLSLAATALLGLAAFASPALAIEQIHIPDSSAAQNSGPPDALFDKSVPTTWQSKQNQQQSNGLGSFHFSAGASSGNTRPVSRARMRQRRVRNSTTTAFRSIPITHRRRADPYPVEL